MKDKEKNPMVELAEQAMKNWEQAIGASIKLQEEVTQRWNQTLGRATTGQEWQRPFMNLASLTQNVMPLAQRRVEEVIELVDESAQIGSQLVKKATDAAQTPVVSESQAKWMDFWTSSLEATRSNADAIMRINTRIIDSWIGLAQRKGEAAKA